jgi:hypothetical protein
MQSPKAETIRAFVLKLIHARKALPKLTKRRPAGVIGHVMFEARSADQMLDIAIIRGEREYLLERFGIEYHSSIVEAVVATKKKHVERLTIRILRSRFFALSEELEKEQSLDRLLLDAVIHAPGTKNHDKEVALVFTGVVGHSLTPVGQWQPESVAG